jgi:hypothetical protein
MYHPNIINVASIIHMIFTLGHVFGTAGITVLVIAAQWVLSSFDVGSSHETVN